MTDATERLAAGVFDALVAGEGDGHFSSVFYEQAEKQGVVLVTRESLAAALRQEVGTTNDEPLDEAGSYIVADAILAALGAGE